MPVLGAASARRRELDVGSLGRPAGGGDRAGRQEPQDQFGRPFMPPVNTPIAPRPSVDNQDQFGRPLCGHPAPS